MAINFTDFFTKFGKSAKAANELLANTGGTQDTNIQAFIDTFDSDALDLKKTIDNTVTRLRALQSANQGAVASLIQGPMRQALQEVVRAETGQTLSYTQALDYFVTAFNAAETVQNVTPTIATVAGGSNTGDGEVLSSLQLASGETNELVLGEAIELECTSVANGVATFSLKSDEAAAALNYQYPAGSGLNSSITAIDASNSANLVSNSKLTTLNSTTSQPDSWVARDANATGQLTDLKYDEIAISGSPTGGWYLIEMVDSNGKKYATDPLVYNAAGSTVQTAIRALPGFSEVEVTTTGTVPNYTHTITYVGTSNAGTPTTVDNFSGGSSPLTTISAIIQTDIDSVSSGRSLFIDGDGSEQTDYYSPVTVTSNTQYGFWALIKQKTVTTGVLTASLVDGITGTVLTDADGNSLTTSVTLSGIGADWYHFKTNWVTPATLPAQVYLRLNCSTAIDASGKLFIDQVFLGQMSRLYRMGPSLLLFKGETDFEVGDTFTTTVTNAATNDLHQWFNRVYELGLIGKQLASSGSPSQADSLMT